MCKTALWEVYEQNDDGKWVVNTEKPFFKEARKKYQDDKCQDGQVAKPRAIYAIELGGPCPTHLYHHMTESIYSLTVYIIQSSDVEVVL